MDAFLVHFANVEMLWRARVVLLEGALGTLQLGLAALLTAPLVGVVVLALQLVPSRAVRSAVDWYIDVMRAFPLLVFLVIAYYLLLPLLGLKLDPFVAATLAFALKHGVYFAEIYRGGWLAVDKGQFMAAEAIGLSGWATMRYVIVPQMMMIMLPALTNQVTLVMRDLPLAFVIGYFEILTSARAAQVFTRNSTPLVGAVAAYAVILLLLQWLTARVEAYSKRQMEG
jgi:polar amino acid transport system permease protein